MLLSKAIRLVNLLILHQKLNEDEQTAFSNRPRAYSSIS
jgi:hypothetical protein